MAEHKPTGWVRGTTGIQCQVCRQAWPCDVARLEAAIAAKDVALREMTKSAILLIEEIRQIVLINSEAGAISIHARMQVFDCRIANLDDRCRAALSDKGEGWLKVRNALQMWDDYFNLPCGDFSAKYPWLLGTRIDDLMCAFTRAALAALEGKS